MFKIPAIPQGYFLFDKSNNVANYVFFVNISRYASSKYAILATNFEHFIEALDSGQALRNYRNLGILTGIKNFIVFLLWCFIKQKKWTEKKLKLIENWVTKLKQYQLACIHLKVHLRQATHLCELYYSSRCKQWLLKV